MSIFLPAISPEVVFQSSAVPGLGKAPEHRLDLLLHDAPGRVPEMFLRPESTRPRTASAGGGKRSWKLVNAREACIYQALERTRVRDEGEDGREKSGRCKNHFLIEFEGRSPHPGVKTISGIDFLSESYGIIIHAP